MSEIYKNIIDPSLRGTLSDIIDDQSFDYEVKLDGIHDVYATLGYITYRGFVYAGFYHYAHNGFIVLSVNGIKRKVDEVNPTEESNSVSDITYDSIVEITERNKGKITIELFNQVLEKIVDSANKGKSDMAYKFNVDNQHLAKDIVDKLKDKGFSNAECHYHGLAFIKVRWC